MKKGFIKRCLTGFFLGVAADYIIAIIVSYTLDLGYFMPCVVTMPEIMGGEMKAVVVQAIAFGLSGCAIAQSVYVAQKACQTRTGRIFLTAFLVALSLIPLAAIAYLIYI